jgi:transcriptional regulator with XRE-family HTH domain
MTNKESNMTIGNKIKKLRELKNFTQEYMAEALQMSQTGYGKIERDETDINYSRLEQIAKVLGTKVADLVSLDERLMLYVINNANAEKSIENINNVGNYYEAEKSFDRERKLYEEQNKSLKEEINHLRGMVSFLQEQLKK